MNAVVFELVAAAAVVAALAGGRNEGTGERGPGPEAKPSSRPLSMRQTRMRQTRMRQSPVRERGWRGPRATVGAIGASAHPRWMGRGSGRAGETARWARRADVAALVVPGHRPPPPGRLVLGHPETSHRGGIGRLPFWGGGHVLAGEEASSLIVFGPTQSGKTTGLAVPAILGWEGPVLAASIKTDLLDHTIHHRSQGGLVSCFDPSGITGRGDVTWSPLPASTTWPGAKRSAATLTEVGRGSVGGMADGDFWFATASRLLAPLLFAAALGRRDMTDVVRWVETGEENEVLDLLTWAGVAPAVDAARSAFAKEERQRSSIVTTLETLLEPFGAAAPHAVPLPVVDPAALLDGSGTLFLTAPAHDQRRLTPLFVGVLRSVLDHAYDQVARTGRPLDPPLLVVLDEAANIAPVPDLDALASTAAGHGIQLVTIWHDLAQMTARFGPRATTVVNNHRAKLFLSGISDPGTLDYASHLIGDEERHQSAVTAGGPHGSSTTRSPSVRRLAPPDALRRLPSGTGVLVYRDLAPARIRLRTWFDEPWLRSRATSEE